MSRSKWRRSNEYGGRGPVNALELRKLMIREPSTQIRRLVRQTNELLTLLIKMRKMREGHRAVLAEYMRKLPEELEEWLW